MDKDKRCIIEGACYVWNAIKWVVTTRNIASIDDLKAIFTEDVLKVVRGRFITFESGEILSAYPQWEIVDQDKFIEVLESMGYIFPEFAGEPTAEQRHEEEQPVDDASEKEPSAETGVSDPTVDSEPTISIEKSKQSFNRNDLSQKIDLLCQFDDNFGGDDHRFILGLSGKKRVYFEDLTCRYSPMEYAKPFLFVVNDAVFTENSWKRLLQSLANWLTKEYARNDDELLVMRTSWGDELFSKTVASNYEPLSNGLYINTNHNAMQSYMLTLELLELFGIDIAKNDVNLFVHRPAYCEPHKFKDSLKCKMVNGFRDYVILDNGKTDAEYCRISSLLTLCNEKLRPKICPICYADLFLFEDITSLRKCTDEINKYLDRAKPAGYDECKDALELLAQFYASRRFKKNYREWCIIE